jgi:hypothetical protein
MGRAESRNGESRKQKWGEQKAEMGRAESRNGESRKQKWGEQKAEIELKWGKLRAASGIPSGCNLWFGAGPP